MTAAPHMTQDDQKIKASFVIVTWNSLDVLRECLASIYRHMPTRDIEVFVVDNNSSDGTCAAIASAFPDVNLICNPDNRGFGRANNQALQRARGRYLVLLNPDTEVTTGAIDRCIAFMASTPDAGVVSGELINPDGSLQAGYFDFPTLRHAISCLSGSVRTQFQQWKAEYSPDPPVREVDWVSGAFMVLRREALLDVGLFDERFFMYWEETEWCLRIRAAGWKIYFLSDVEIIHHHRVSTRKAPFEIKAEAVRSQQILFWTHYPRGEAWALMLASLATGAGFIAKGAYGLPTQRDEAASRVRTGRRILRQSLQTIADRKSRVPRLESARQT